MTDTPGWASPSSSEPPREDARPQADAPAAVPGQSAPPHSAPPAAPPAPAGWTGPQWGSPQGAPGGPQYGWGATPPSPKPGIIPLRPLGFGEILDGAVDTIRRHWRTTLGLALGIAVVQQAATTFAQLKLGGDTGDLTSTVAMVATVPVELVLTVFATALLTMVVSRAVLGRSATIGDAWRDARPRLLQLTGLTLLTALILFGVILLGFSPALGYALAGAGEPAITALLIVVGLLSIPVAVWLWIQLSLAAPALMLEKQGVLTALSRSRRLVRGSWWRLFGLNVVTQVMVALAAFIIAIPFTVIGTVIGYDDLMDASTDALPVPVLIGAAIAGVISATVTIPFTGTIGVLLYIDQRIRREALDIELARAAGLPEFGAGGVDGPPTAKL
ncbi:DUF7847 domain-containing protein [Kitasatospora sp. NPDC054939]